MTDPRKDVSSPLVIDNSWSRLRQFTDARIGLGRSGISLPTSRLLEFQLAHAQAQDAVHCPLDVERLCRELDTAGLPMFREAPVLLHSRAGDRSQYLQRPDYGRRLDDASAERLRALVQPARLDGDETEIHRSPYDLAVVIVDGLSSLAIQNNTVPFLSCLNDALERDGETWSTAPLTLVEQGRVAIGDEVGELLNAHCVLLLIGERPGLSSPDSLGLYLTWQPRVGLTDAARNCISNVRQAGLNYPDAVARALYLLREARRLELSGVGLKDRSVDSECLSGGAGHNFLTSDF